MSSYRLTNQADSDLFDIFVYGIDIFGEVQALNYQKELSWVFGLLAENPHLGRLAPAIGRDIRRHEHASHVILYEEDMEGIVVLAIIHGRAVSRLRL
ncbi:type II toxin-antitoxin system RelE/ParE family toxin [Labrys okinawensis]|uniref:type II toxin-antitoxin system RelE/ParE family toxin n=1 Tax=Labrys okinawensis TaxID=346911 RepID=UPI0039BCA690